MQIPTIEAYSEIQAAFDHFNETLFNSELAPPLFTFQRERRTYGYCSRQRFVSRSNGEFVDEIAINPSYFAIRSIRDTLSTLVHEMVHQWQNKYGKPGRRGYHNKEWAEKMELIGLMPSNNGEPGGKKTGEQMTHYIICGASFDLSCEALLTTEFTLSWLDRYPAERPALSEPAARTIDELTTGAAEDPDLAKKYLDLDELPEISGVVLPSTETINRSNRDKYYCDECAGQVWSKPGMLLFCGGRNNPEDEPATHSVKAMRVII